MCADTCSDSRGAARVVRCSSAPLLPASHEDPSNPATLRRVLARETDFPAGPIQALSWAALLPGRTFQAHYHESLEEFFVIIDGCPVAYAGSDQRWELTPGDLWVVPPMTVHRMENPTSSEVRFLLVGISTGKPGRTVKVPA